MSLPLPKLDYARLFRNPRMFDSKSAFVAAGFDVTQAANHNIMVGSHPSTGEYLFKKYNADVELDDQEDNYETRARGADKIRALIDRHQLDHLVVPHKWIYELPRSFADRKQKSYVLVVERIHLVSMDETFRRYRNISTAVLDDLCHVLHRFSGLDAAPHNLQFSTSGKIAFIDTESWDRPHRDGTRVFRRLFDEMSKESRKHVTRMLDKLDEY